MSVKTTDSFHSIACHIELMKTWTIEWIKEEKSASFYDLEAKKERTEHY